MIIIKASYEILTSIDGEQMLKDIEKIGRTCYKSENLITEDSSKVFVRNLINRGHEAMLEHNAITVRFICDRGVSHELVRHRMASFAQESTRYCNYSEDKFGNELTFIKPCFLEEVESPGHPQMRELAIPLCRELQEKIPVVFDNIIKAGEE